MFGSISACICGVVLLLIVAECMSATIDYPIATTQKPAGTSPKSRYEQGLEDYDEAKENYRKSRGMMPMADYSDHHIYHDHDHDHDHLPQTTETPKEEEKAVKDDPWQNYYDFIINEGSFKFWAAFQLATAALLIYSAFAAVYYAKFNVITTDYDYDYDFFGRSNNEGAVSSIWNGLSSQTFQRIFDAISSKKYT